MDERIIAAIIGASGTVAGATGAVVVRKWIEKASKSEAEAGLSEWPVKRMERPWGHLETYVVNAECSIRLITIAPNARLSKKKHFHRDEVFVILDRGVCIELDDCSPVRGRKGDIIVVPRRRFHRLSAGNRGGRAIELAFGKYDESDFERSEDDFGRPLEASASR